MAIDNTTVFDRVMVACDCRNLTLQNIIPINNLGIAQDGEIINADTTDAGEIAQLDIMRDAVRDGVGPAAATTLDEDITDSETSIDVDDAANLRVNQKIRVGDEIMLITAISTNTLTVTRAQDGTSAQSNIDGTNVFKVVELYYYDRGYIAYEDLPLKHWVIHTLHDIHPDEKWKTLATMMLASDVSEDADTGKPSVTVGVDLGARYRVPDGDNYDAPLDTLTVIPVDDDSFQMQLNVTPAQGDGITVDNIANTANELKIANFPGMRTWKAFLRSIHHNNSIPADALWGYDYDADFGNTNFDWEQESGSTVRFQIAGGLTIMSPGYNGAGNLRSLTVEFNVTSDSPADYNEDLMQVYLDTQTVSTPVDGLALEPTSFGSAESRGEFERLTLGSGWLYRRADGAIVDNYEVGLNGEMEHTPISGDFGESVDMVDISVATGDTYKRIPTGPYVNAVHLADSGVSADQDLQLPIPTKAVGAKDRDRGYLIHNKNATYKIKLRDWDGNVFFHVEPGERTYWRMTQEAWAYGEWTSVSLPTRHIVYNLARGDGDLGELDDLANLEADETEGGTTINAKAYVLPQPSSVDDYDFIHDDFFKVWTSGDFADDFDIVDGTSKADYEKVGAIEIVGDVTGFIQTDVNLDLRLHSSETGDVTDAAMKLYRFRVTDPDTDADAGAATIFADQTSDDLTSGGARESARLLHRGRIQKGDILVPAFWMEDGQTLSALNRLQLRRLEFEMTVEPEITLEYSP